MHLDYTTFQGRRIPYFKSKQDAEQALLGGLIKDGQEVAVNRDSFPQVQAGHAYIFAKGLSPLIAEEVLGRERVGAQFARREAESLAAKQAAERSIAARASRESAARASAQRVVARTASERALLRTEQDAAAARTSARASAEQASATRDRAVVQGSSKRGTAGFVAKGATVTAVIGAGAIGGTALVAQFKKEPQSQVTDLPNGDKLVTYPDGSTAIVDKNGKVKSTSGPSGLKGTTSGISDLFKWGAVAAVVVVGASAINRSSKAKSAKAAASKPMKAAGKAISQPANLKPLAA